jgi:hypothetical protein
MKVLHKAFKSMNAIPTFKVHPKLKITIVLVGLNQEYLTKCNTLIWM